APGDGRGHAGRRAVRPDRRAVRLLSLSRQGDRAPAGFELPPVQLPRRPRLSAEASSLPAGPAAVRCAGSAAAAPSMSLLSPAGMALVKLMGDMPRGPRRDGAFALWL